MRMQALTHVTMRLAVMKLTISGFKVFVRRTLGRLNKEKPMSIEGEAV